MDLVSLAIEYCTTTERNVRESHLNDTYREVSWSLCQTMQTVSCGFGAPPLNIMASRFLRNLPRFVTSGKRGADASLTSPVPLVPGSENIPQYRSAAGRFIHFTGGRILRP